MLVRVDLDIKAQSFLNCIKIMTTRKEVTFFHMTILTGLAPAQCHICVLIATRQSIALDRLPVGRLIDAVALHTK